ncbi:uncharacterized protein LOC111064613 isoform X2 [Nilaparvata lugens]|uniref:uncharacterized protein LOC111064613 isoform X2 n=1 Tax=Nilaparvata lugens TaxID=108931 RepID=UPI00193D5FA5|nr:uncharacterized protein LOC111064613 isoform X2 [Nilaparvata lugens]
MNMNLDVIADIRIFMKDTLAKEQLSCSAEKERLRLVGLLEARENSPAPYLDMCPAKKCESVKENNEDDINNQCYEELSDTRSSLTSDYSLGEKNERNRMGIDDLGGNLYYNIPDVFISTYWDAENERRRIPESRNSVCSLSASQSGKGSADGTESSESVSGSSSSLAGSTFGGGTAPKTPTTTTPDGVLAVSPSALRYTASKCGPLSRKEKFLFLDHHKQYWAALVGRLLYIYTNEKESKPVAEICVESYQARPVATKSESPKKDCSFEIFCPGNKTYQFTAPSNNEMDQWVTAICEAGKSEATGIAVTSQPESQTQTGARQLPSIPDEQALVQAYDMPDARARPVAPQQYELINTDAYYHCIDNDNATLKQVASQRNSRIEEELTYENDDVIDENFYYNVVSPCESESFYDTIPGVTEKKLMLERELQMKYLREQQNLLIQQNAPCKDHDTNEAGGKKITDQDSTEQALYENQDETSQQLTTTPKEQPIKKSSNCEIRTGPVSSRIQQIIQRIEEAAGTSAKTQKTVHNDFYEPVDTSDAIAHSRTISR